MGATSVTGLSGPGSAAKYGAGNKGSEHMALGVHRLIGPRVVGCSDVTLDASGLGIVVFPALPGGPDLYCPFLSFECEQGAVAPCWSDFTATSFNVSGSANTHVCWQIVKKGLWGSLENDGPSAVIAKT
jgi:hypothetical protein